MVKPTDTGDPVPRLIRNIDILRMWLVFFGAVTAILTLAVLVLAFGVHDLTDYVHKSAHKRATFSCQVERKFNLRLEDCP